MTEFAKIDDEEEKEEEIRSTAGAEGERTSLRCTAAPGTLSPLSCSHQAHQPTQVKLMCTGIVYQNAWLWVAHGFCSCRATQAITRSEYDGSSLTKRSDKTRPVAQIPTFPIEGADSPPSVPTLSLDMIFRLPWLTRQQGQL
ncbi:hypothetical protein NPX13_g654 [Xylaria arbuscula]|uniref:Uncharacterized protein n=1 Tax=Xylaria arbuscula TaxID=114810 RepID=A0A9W8NN40_9PEZI|nr:hypothetical protein NPX13_g654 [Xylaria arbuscula]